MSWDLDSRDNVYAAAAAATAFAIHTLEEVEAENRIEMREEDFESSRNRIKSRSIDIKTGMPATAKMTRQSSTNKAEASARKLPDRVFPTADASRRSENLSRHGKEKTKADAWDKKQMEMIRVRHEKIKSSILAWEKEKKMRAKMSFDRKRNELEQRIARHRQHYQNKIANIDQIARGARAQAEEKRKIEESQVKDKAKNMRSGAVSIKCFCL